MKASTFVTLIILAGLVIVAASSVFVVPQGSQAIVLQFGQWRRTVATPGLHVKTPLIEDVMAFEARTLDIEPAGQQVTLGDKTRLEVDAYGRYRITDPRRFYQALQNETAARLRLSNIVNSSISEILAHYTLADLLSKKREEILEALCDRVRRQATDMGVEIVDVRIRRADLPAETSAPIYQRMISERQREAAQARAEGQETAARIRSEADRDRTQLLSEANRDADIERGQGDREALETIAAATNRDPGFYAFYRSLSAYRTAFGDGSDTTLLLPPDSRFLDAFSHGYAGVGKAR